MFPSATTVLLALMAAAPTTLACLGAKSKMPAATGTKSLTSPQTIGAGQLLDGKFVRYDRGAGACQSGEGGQSDAVFVLQNGATLRNVIIGAHQKEGVYCLGSCTLENVWFEDVCEDAISIKGDGIANIVGGGALKAEDKIIQHNGCGTVNIKNFYASDYGKVYRSCGNCKKQCARTVNMSGVTAVNGGELMGINKNLGDKATYSNNCGAKTVCQDYTGCTGGGCEAKKAGKC